MTGVIRCGNNIGLDKLMNIRTIYFVVYCGIKC